MSKTARELVKAIHKCSGNKLDIEDDKMWLYCSDSNMSLSGDAILAALREEGYRIVPAEPTKEMILAVYPNADEWTTPLLLKDWNAMIAAADGE